MMGWWKRPVMPHLLFPRRDVFRRALGKERPTYGRNGRGSCGLWPRLPLAFGRSDRDSSEFKSRLSLRRPSHSEFPGVLLHFPSGRS